MLQKDDPSDYVIATGKSVSLEYFVSRAFNYFGLDWSRYVRQDSALFRPSDIQRVTADPSYANRSLGWKAEFTVDHVIDEMCSATRLYRGNEK